eukprot:PhF_6_TR44141/c0_g1_i2/m.67485
MTLAAVAGAIAGKLKEIYGDYQHMKEDVRHLTSTLDNVIELVVSRGNSQDFQNSAVQKNLEKKLHELQEEVAVIQLQEKSIKMKLRNAATSCVGSGYTGHLAYLKMLTTDLNKILDIALLQTITKANEHIANIDETEKIKKIIGSWCPLVTEFWINASRAKVVLSWDVFQEQFLLRYAFEIQSMYGNRANSLMRMLRSKMDIGHDGDISVEEFGAFFCPPDVSGGEDGGGSRPHQHSDPVDVLKFHSLQQSKALLPVLSVGYVGSHITQITDYHQLLAFATPTHIKVLEMNEPELGFLDVCIVAVQSAVSVLKLYMSNDPGWTMTNEILLLYSESRKPYIVLVHAWVGNVVAKIDVNESDVADACVSKDRLFVCYRDRHRVRVLRRRPDTNTWVTTSFVTMSPSVKNVSIVDDEGKYLIVGSRASGLALWDTNTETLVRNFPNMQYYDDFDVVKNPHGGYDVAVLFANRLQVVRDVQGV